ncbi:hypothetical protein K466DRAFT_495922 [Polyporus arcularius HHB13444]|uniref:Uncharacterized protein n=1 Tax=Polyporus arcularius HHB13444 TaxID=1314778 RepID=A0A5C3P555_9APHY|nr:hypothetical protein K466DRAFT_495922 [Polyporus arcularius HHB13444]
MSRSLYPHPVLCLVLCSVVFTTCGNIALIIYILRSFKGLVPAEPTYSYIGYDFPAQLPLQLASVGLSLDDESDGSHFSLEADDEWGTQFPLHDGFTSLGRSNRTFLVSMVHQMHCLDVIRVGFVTNATGYHRHVEHCLRYLRQIVLCYADTTLEVDEPGIKDGEMAHAASGVGAIHRCKDWTVLRRYLEAHPSVPFED